MGYNEKNEACCYYPLTKEAKELDLPLLPNPFEEEPLMKQASKLRELRGYHKDNHYSFCGGFIEGYKAAQSDKRFSLEDVKKAIQMAKTLVEGKQEFEIENILGSSDGTYGISEKYTEEEIIQALSTQQLPKVFIPEYTNTNSYGSETNGYDSGNFILKTITNSEGKEELIGTYKY